MVPLSRQNLDAIVPVYKDCQERSDHTTRMEWSWLILCPLFHHLRALSMPSLSEDAYQAGERSDYRLHHVLHYQRETHQFRFLRVTRYIVQNIEGMMETWGF